MDDIIHNDLCIALYDILLSEPSIKTIIKFVDNAKYYNIFTYKNRTIAYTYINKLIDYLCDKNNDLHHVITHIITTRKLNAISNNIFKLMKTKKIITKFFSLYNDAEISAILYRDMHKTIEMSDFILQTYNRCAMITAIWYKEKGYKITLIFYSIIHNNRLLFDFILDYMNSHNLSTFIKMTHYNFIYFYESLHGKSLEAKLITKHEETIMYRGSLRNTWISSCTF